MGGGVCEAVPVRLDPGADMPGMGLLEASKMYSRLRNKLR